MNSNLSLIKALATTLLSELDSIEPVDDILDDENFSLTERVQEFEIKLIKLALTVTGGNQTRAAHLLKIKNSTLHNKIKSYRIEYLKFNNPELPVRLQAGNYRH